MVRLTTDIYRLAWNAYSWLKAREKLLIL